MTPNPRSRRSGRSVLLGAAGVLVITVIVIVLSSSPPRSQQDARRAQGNPAVGSPPQGARNPVLEPFAGGTVLQQQEWDDLVASGAAAAARGNDAVRGFVYQLFAALDQLAPGNRVEVVLAFFDTGRDVRFGPDFTVGPGGFLLGWPSMRVALFDYLAQRDGSAARELAKKLLQQRPDEPGEWTLALRELVRGRSLSNWAPLVVERVHDFLVDPEWREKSEQSWLEGFDLVVASRSARFLPDLSALTLKDRETLATRHAAFLAADRMALSAPVEILSALNSDSDLFASEPNVRAGLFARADVRRLDQRRELETYFSRGDIAELERASFADLFPLYDLAISRNLITRSSTRPLVDMLDQDRATFAVLEEWMADSRWAMWHPSFRVISNRLKEQLRNAAGGDR